MNEQFTLEELMRLSLLVTQKIKRTKSEINKRKYQIILQKINTQEPKEEGK